MAGHLKVKASGHLAFKSSTGHLALCNVVASPCARCSVTPNQYTVTIEDSVIETACFASSSTSRWKIDGLSAGAGNGTFCLDPVSTCTWRYTAPAIISGASITKYNPGACTTPTGYSSSQLRIVVTLFKVSNTTMRLTAILEDVSALGPNSFAYFRDNLTVPSLECVNGLSFVNEAVLGGNEDAVFPGYQLNIGSGGTADATSGC